MRVCYHLLHQVLHFYGEPCLKNKKKNPQHTQKQQLLLFLRGSLWLLDTVTKAKDVMKENKMDFFFSNISYPSPVHNNIHAWGKVVHLNKVLTMTPIQLLRRFANSAGRAPCAEQARSFHSPLLHIYFLTPQQQSTGLCSCSVRVILPCNN